MKEDSQEAERNERQRQLGEELEKLQEDHRASQGAKIIMRTRAFGTSYRVFLGNHAELRGFLDHIAAPLVNVNMWDERHRYRVDYALDEVARLLHNYISAVISLVDATRVFVRTHYAGTELFKEYERRVKSDFADAPLHRFLQDLRNYSLHYRLPAMRAITSFKRRKDGGFDLDNAFRLDTNKLKEWDGWKAKAREYLETLGSEADLRHIIDAYEPVVTDFQRWLADRINQEHISAIKELANLEKRMARVERDWRISWGDSQVLLEEEAAHESSEVPLAERSTDAATSDFGTIDDLIATFYESTSYPLGGLPNLDRFRSLFLPGAYLVRIEEGKAYLTDIDGYIKDFLVTLTEGKIVAVSEVEVDRRGSKFGNIAHVVSTSIAHSIENGRTKVTRGFHSLHLVEDEGRWIITSMLWGSIEPASDLEAADSASGIEDSATSDAQETSREEALQPDDGGEARGEP